MWFAYRFFPCELIFADVAEEEHCPLPNYLDFGSNLIKFGAFTAVAKLKILKPLSSSKSFPPTFPSLFSTLQVFQKCTVKDVGGKNLVEPTPRIEPQIRELRPGAILPLKEKKVKYWSPRSNPANCLPLPTV